MTTTHHPSPHPVPYPVDSTTRECCGGIGRHTRDCKAPDVAPPPGANCIDDWADDDPQPYRIVFGADRTITDHRVRVSTSAVQWADGTVDDGRIEGPSVCVFDLGESNPLNSDQARELASVLLQAADEIDGWAAL